MIIENFYFKKNRSKWPQKDEYKCKAVKYDNIVKIALSWRIVPFEIYEWEATDKSPTHNFQTVNSSSLIKFEIEFSKV